jgi:uncharacterized protein (DUF1697 family)
MSGKQIALIRGINVGRAKRIAMADLRELIEELGFSNVRTILNSGNAIFTSSDKDTLTSASRIEKELYARTGISARVMVFSEEELKEIVKENSLAEVANDPSRLLVMFLQNSGDLMKLKPLKDQEWTPDILSIGTRAAYLWCSEGILASRLNEAADRIVGEMATTRNWSTVMKLYALMENKAN